MTYPELCSRLDALYFSGDRDQLFDLVRSLALYRLRDEDAAQSATLRVWEYIGQYEPRCPFSHWVNKIVSNQRRYLGEEAARQAQQETFSDLCLASDVRPARPVPLPVFPNAKAARVYALKADGYDLREIAAMVGLTYGSLRVQCHRWEKEMRPAS